MASWPEMCHQHVMDYVLLLFVKFRNLQSKEEEVEKRPFSIIPFFEFRGGS